MSTQGYRRKQNQLFVAKVEAVEGTAESLTTATDSIPAETTTVTMNPQVLESNEATASLIVGQRVVTRFDPRFSTTFKMRGSGSVATAPRISAVLRSGGFAEQILAVLPSSSTFTAASGTTKSITIDRTAGTGTQLAATQALLAVQLIGRVMTLAVNPVTPRDVVITGVSLSAPNVTITFGETLATAADATTTAVIKAGTLYQPTTTIPSVTANIYRDGKMRALVGCRPKLSFKMPGAERPTVAADFAGTFASEADVSVPTDANFASLPAEPIWRNGRAWLNYLDTGVSDFGVDMGASDTRYPNPNLQYGEDRNIITKLDPTGTLNVNTKLVAVQDLLTNLAANTLMPFISVTDMSGSAGTRLAMAVPNALLIDDGDGDREGIMEDQLKFQCVNISPIPAITAFFY